MEAAAAQQAEEQPDCGSDGYESDEVEEDPDEGVLLDVEFVECEDARRAETEAERLACEALAD